LDDAVHPLKTAIERLTDDDGLPAGQLMAWAGFDDGDSDRRPSGFERASQAVYEMIWLRDRLQAWAARTARSSGGNKGRRSLEAARGDVVAILSPAYAKYFGRPMGRGRSGPAMRFLQAFFRSVDDHPHEATLVKLIRSIR
jgi:hypothetical protein